MRPKKFKKRGQDPPPTSSQAHSDGSTSIELTTQRKRDLLASVGFLEEDEELPQVQLAGSIKSCNRTSRQVNTIEEEYYHEREERRRRKQQMMKHAHNIDFDELEFAYEDELNEESYFTEEDELFGNTNGDEDEYSECSQDEIESSRDGRCCQIATKLIYIIAIVAAFIYIFGDDSNTTNTLEQDPAKHEYYSYKGYKDGRIPDDDIAQSGGDVLFQQDDYNGINDDEASANNNQDVADSSVYEFIKHSTGVPNEESLWQDLTGYADLSEPYNPEAGDIAFFWHIPKCGGTTLQDLMIHCIGMVGANEIGGSYVNDGPSLQIVQLENGNRYVNVDVTQPDGIQHAHDLGFASSGLADVAMSSRFHNAAFLFVPSASNVKTATGRCFTLLRHPIRRAISMFYYLRDATWEHTYSEIYKSMTIEEYAVSQYAEDNWMVRFLTNEMTGVLNDAHLDLAKQILQAKCLVGLMEQFPQSVKRFDRYFGWGKTDFQGGPVKMSDRGVCEAHVMSKPDNVHEHPTFDEGSEVWNKLLEKNILDVRLYAHAVELFQSVQAKLVGDQP